LAIAEVDEELSEFELLERSPPAPAFVPGARLSCADPAYGA
jgi:hypothetical protein